MVDKKTENDFFENYVKTVSLDAPWACLSLRRFSRRLVCDLNMQLQPDRHAAR